MALTKIIYAQTVDNLPAKYQRSYKDCLIDVWLKENCQNPYYHSPGWTTEKFIEFECSKDAMMFALRWAQ